MNFFITQMIRPTNGGTERVDTWEESDFNLAKLFDLWSHISLIRSLRIIYVHFSYIYALYWIVQKNHCVFFI